MWHIMRQSFYFYFLWKLDVMHFLILSICASVSVAVLLKIARQKQWAIEQMVGVNYGIAIILTLLFLNPKWDGVSSQSTWLFAALGVLMPTIFVAMGRSVAAVGIVKSDAAQRLSLFLPVLAAFTIFGEAVLVHRVVGLVLAVLALCCLLWKRSDVASTTQGGAWWLLAVWLGYGVIDILFKQLSKQGAAFSDSLLRVFILAGTLMMTYLFIRKTRWQAANIGAGVLLGCLNFMNILFYIKAHQAFQDSPTIVFAGMNMGVIVLGTLAGAVGFGERMSKLNGFGVGLALLAITCLCFGQNWFGG